ncbi:MAG: hypothetical protein KAY37_00375 [Phycisphaerae bacterium]|nr:hypothetical protein [Phycisphaerae bacterium]
MAGRPVSVQSSQTALLSWVIVFAILMVASLVLFILQLTDNKAAKNEARRATQKAEFHGRPAQYYEDEARSRKTNVFATMNSDLRLVAGLVSAPDDVGTSVHAKYERTMDDVAARTPINPDLTLLSAVTTLADLYEDERARADATQSRADELQREKDNMTAQLKTTRDEFEAQVASLSERLQQNEEEKNTALRQKDVQLHELQASVNALEQQLQKIKREGNVVVRDKDVEIGHLETQVATLQKQIQALKPTTFDPNAILTKADGRILRAVPGSDIVYINVGAADRIKVGMGFEVFSRSREASDGLRGKASLAVATVMEGTAECRVTRRNARRPIIEGDIVVNIAFERDRKPKFVVRGEFDLDYDGVPDAYGRKEVASLVRQWGGQVVDELDESVDFVVIGQSPSGPRFDDKTVVSDIVRDQARRKELAGLQFVRLLDRAASMYIPVITQNQFLFLTGYAGDGTVARR